MSNKDNVKREVSASELEQLKDKYPQMAQKFEELKNRLINLKLKDLSKLRNNKLINLRNKD